MEPDNDPQATREAAYYLSLGKFVDAYSRVELCMQMVLRYYTNVTVPISRAVFSGDRTKTIHGYLKRLSEIGVITSEKWNILKPVLEHLSKINDLRNIILHYGASAIGGDNAFVTDSFMALTDNRKKTFPISVEILENMTFDCCKIGIHLSVEHTEMTNLPLDRIPEPMRNMIDASWRYIPPQPNQNRLHPGGKTKKHQRPPTPSQG